MEVGIAVGIEVGIEVDIEVGSMRAFPHPTNSPTVNAKPTIGSKSLLVCMLVGSLNVECAEKWAAII